MPPDTLLPAYPPAHPALEGHFPGHPIVPGVLLLDAALHSAGLAAPLRIDQVKFSGVVRPGEALALHVDGGGYGKGARLSVRHDARPVASVSLPAAPGR